MTTTAVASSWGTVALRDCCDIVAGSTPSREVAQFWDGPIPWATPKDLSELDSPVLENTPEGITQEGFDSCSTQMLPKGAVLFSSRAPIGLVAIAGRPMCTNQGFKSFVPGPGVDSLYLYYCLKSMVPQIQARGNGATFKEVSKEVIGTFEIPIPFPDDPRRSLAEQKRIAAILDKADAIRRRRQEAARLADTLIPSVFYEMFGDPVLNRKGFPSLPMSECAEVQGGLALSQTARGAYELEVPYLRVANVLRDRLDLTEVKTIGLNETELEKTRLRRDDVLIVEGHGNRDEVGRSAIWDGSIAECVHQNHLIRVRADRKKATAEFLNAFINSDAGRRQLFRHGKTTSGLNTISLSNVRSVVTLVPPLPLQERFSRVVSALREAVTQRSTTTRECETLFNALVQRAFRGEL